MAIKTPFERIRELREKGITLYPNLTPEQRRNVLFIEEEPITMNINPPQEQLNQMTAAYNAEVKKGQLLLQQRTLLIAEVKDFALYCDRLLMDVTGNEESGCIEDAEKEITKILKITGE